MQNPVPTLSTDGWVKDPKSKLDVIFSDFLVCLHSQYPQAKIKNSMSWLAATLQDAPSDMAAACEQQLKASIEKYFVSASVTCRIQDHAERADFVELVIQAVGVDEDNQTHDLSAVFVVGEQRVVSFATKNNGSLPIFVG